MLYDVNSYLISFCFHFFSFKSALHRLIHRKKNYNNKMRVKYFIIVVIGCQMQTVFFFCYQFYELWMID